MLFSMINIFSWAILNILFSLNIWLSFDSAKNKFGAIFFQQTDPCKSLEKGIVRDRIPNTQ